MCSVGESTRVSALPESYPDFNSSSICACMQRMRLCVARWCGPWLNPPCCSSQSQQMNGLEPSVCWLATLSANTIININNAPGHSIQYNHRLLETGSSHHQIDFALEVRSRRLLLPGIRTFFGVQPPVIPNRIRRSTAMRLYRGLPLTRCRVVLLTTAMISSTSCFPATSFGGVSVKLLPSNYS